MLLLSSIFAGLTMQCPVILMELVLESITPSMDTLMMCTKLEWTEKYQILRGREMHLEDMAGSLRNRFNDSHNIRSTGGSLRPLSLMCKTVQGRMRMGMKILNLRRVLWRVSL